MKLTIVIWDTLYPTISSLARTSEFDTKVYSERELDTDRERLELLKEDLKGSNIIVIHRTTHQFWDEIVPFISDLNDKKIICFGQDPSYWGLSTVDPAIVSKVYAYEQSGDHDNLENMFRFIENTFIDDTIPYSEPKVIPWQGIVHPDDPKRIFPSSEEYLEWYGHRDRRLVALILSRSSWISNQHPVEDELIRELENVGLGVVPIMTNSLHNEEMGSINIAECIELHLIRDGRPIVSALVKLVTFLIGKRPDLDHETSSRLTDELLASMNIPIFQPIISLESSLEEWGASDGITADIPWSVTMPEFEGAIEPLMLAATRSDSNDLYNRCSVPGRCRRIAERIKRRIGLAEKDNSEKRVVLILNNSPCASVEANIGSAAGLDSAASVVNILRGLCDAGYDVDVPESSEALTRLFMERKAYSEFRWTSKEMIRDSGGCIYMMPGERYEEYFSTLPEKVRTKMIGSWGEPPGESMCIDGNLMITGLRFGNAIVMVQPKRGCMGAKCDGTACMILHDPECPPSHQYLATYHFIRDVFKADAIIHVGTHGTTEFLPGKAIGLSEDCYPDITVRDMPVFYAYNTDNPPEGSVAKRRIYSTLIGHMQAPTAMGGLYGAYQRLDDIVNEYETSRFDPARAHALQHEILEVMEECGLDDVPADHDGDMDSIIARCHDMLSLMRNSRTETGLHTFGSELTFQQTVDLISSIMSRSGEPSLPQSVASAMGLDYSDLLSNRNVFDKDKGVTKGALAETVIKRCNIIIKLTLRGMDEEGILSSIGSDPIDGLDSYMDRIRDIATRMGDSDEIGSLINALNGGYTSAGPSGYISRGRDDVLPTGRNFYSLDPRRVPTRSAWRVGTRLADALLDKYVQDEGDYPESVAFQWMTNDIMASDGEMMAEIFSLLGVEPVWNPAGHVNSFRIVPQEQLVHPRIDVTARISGILRDTFPDRLDLVDSAIRAVAALDEPDDVNFIAKHVREELSNGTDMDGATARLFSSKPGTYTSGVNLAVLSGAWTDEKDLAGIYISVNGYAYGGGRKGKESQLQFASALENVSLTFNKVVSDDHDLLGCCCYYSNQGGLTAAARQMSEKKVNTYYGDTRERDSVGVRTLSDEIGRVVRSKLLNPKWIEGMKAHGYKGAADMMKKITRVYGWGASTGEVEDAIFDGIADTYVNDPEMRRFFGNNNPHAAEEISRRLLEAESRGIWDADEETLDRLRSSYLEIESWMEDLSDGEDIQGGEASMISPEELPIGKDIAELMNKIHDKKARR
ncbi:MAG: cobaltochelatase subunit CobN [Candidatus Methanomethylophilaceae archaeon]|nr:cobaltochelatase subunit CobN [Candidatus Methanomethylophilaceae archaeon]